MSHSVAIGLGAAASILAFYGLCWGATVAAREKYLELKCRFDATVGHVFFGFLWPAYLPALLAYVGATNFKVPKMPSFKRKTREDEIAPGIPCSVHILAGMVETSLLQKATVNPYSLVNDKVKVCFGAYHLKVTEMSMGKLKFTSEEIPESYHSRFHQLYKQLDGAEREREKAAKEADRQMRAIDGIEQLLEPVK